MTSKAMSRIRKKKRQKGEDLVVPEITLDLMIEILTRLPAKSLMVFKCVSKVWFSLIRSRYFSNLYLTVASPPRSPRLFLSFMDFDYDPMEVCPKLGKSLLVSLSSSSSNNDESFDHDLTMPGLGGHDMVVFRGLILYLGCGKTCIYNPTTRQNLTLPAVKSNIFPKEGSQKCINYFLGHDPVFDQYKVISIVSIYSKGFKIITSEHWVFVLKVGGSWKRIEYDQFHVPSEAGACINGVIYYLADTSKTYNIVVSFDVRSQEFSMIQTPDDVSDIFEFAELIEYGGRPAILDDANLEETGSLELWVLEDGVKWSKKSLVLQTCHRHLVDNDVDLIVAGTTRNGEVILAPLSEPYPCYILYYDLQKNDLRKVEIRGIPDHEFPDPFIYIKLMDHSESIMHLET